MKFTSKCKSIQVGNGVFVYILFVIPVIAEAHGQKFEIYTMVSEIHNVVDMVIGMTFFRIRI